MKISVIIPTLNEAENIGRLIDFFHRSGSGMLAEILVIDGGSHDKTVEIARSRGAKILFSKIKSRAAQMNLGAKNATAEILYFIHADTFPPENFAPEILKAVENGLSMGCFCYRFDSPRRCLKFNAWFTQFNFFWCQGGDKTFFIRRDIFEDLGGYDEKYVVMEEYDFIRRATKKYPMRTLHSPATVSARKYEHNSWLRVQLANVLVFNLFRLGVAPVRLKKIYHKILK